MLIHDKISWLNACWTRSAEYKFWIAMETDTIEHDHFNIYNRKEEGNE